MTHVAGLITNAAGPPGGFDGAVAATLAIGLGLSPAMPVSSIPIAVLLLTVQLPPPICRGRVVSAYDPRLDRMPSARALAEVRTAYDALCPKRACGTGELRENATIGNNAATWVSGIRDGQATRAKIVYSKRFLNALASQFGAGASFGVLAHEVGHHLTAALSLRAPFESSWNEELRADYLAGCALGRAGRSSDELENALRALASVATRSHPSFAERIPVVRKGYHDCRQSAAQAERARPAFGLGSLLSNDAAGCWSYGYRLEEERRRVGPLAAARRSAGPFETETACEAHRRAAEENWERKTERCVCAPR